MSKLQNYYGSYDVPVPIHVRGQPKGLKCDLAVIGGGGAGLSAAARAAQLGKKVVLVEKMSVLGGNTRLAGGLLATNSKLLAEAGVPDMTEEHINEYRRQHMYTLNDSIFTRFIRNTGTVYDWLVENGLDHSNTRVIMDRVVMIKERTEWEPLRNPAYGPGLMGTAVTDTLIAMLERYGVTVLLETAVSELVMQGDTVTGVRAVGGGFDYEISADGVILATGGFGCDNELLKKYFPQYFTSDNYFSHYCLRHCTGDGIRMAEAIGAETGKFMSIGLESMAHIPGAHSLQRIIINPEGIIVSATGKRFLPEDDIENGEYVLDAQPNGEGWYLFNEANKDKMYQLALDRRRYGDWMPEFEEFYQDIEEELGLGLMKKGETIEALAAELGAPAEVLRATIESYDRFCRNGFDEQFCKPAEHLMAMGTEGPWYAVRMTRKFDVTMGGVSVDSRIRALRPDGSVIPGLYVCGDVASNWMGSDYGPLFSSFAWAINSGYLAAGEFCGTSTEQ